MAKKFKTFVQVAFLKVFQGEEQVGIAVRQMFYPLYNVKPSETVQLREPEVRKMSDYSPVEYSLDGRQWSPLRNGRPI